MDVAVILSSDNDLCEAARSTHLATGGSSGVSVEAAVFNGGRKPLIMKNYVYTHQLRFDDFEATQDNFDYRNPVPETMGQIFVSSCATIRKDFP